MFVGRHRDELGRELFRELVSLAAAIGFELAAKTFVSGRVVDRGPPDGTAHAVQADARFAERLQTVFERTGANGMQVGDPPALVERANNCRLEQLTRVGEVTIDGAGRQTGARRRLLNGREELILREHLEDNVEHGGPIPFASSDSTIQLRV